MKVDFSIQDQEVEFIGTEEVRSKKLEIKVKNTPYIVSLLTKVYSDKAGSIVREITSNCFDAHVKAGVVGEPVIVRKYIDDTGQYFIEFVDQGCGISPNDMDEIYMSLGESDKRETDDFIGAFGLGSKSPLCYTSYFYLITRVNGIEYTYLMNESVDGINYDCLIETECDPSKNGTTVRVPIKQNDIRTFEKAINHQLKYFTDVFVVGFDVKNDYKITEFNTFKAREDLFLSDKTKELHIIHGKVTYPINWDAINEQPIGFNAGLSFENGELDVILNREDLKYTDETIKKIKDKLILFKEEVKSIILSKNNTEFTNLRKYIHRSNEVKGDYFIFNIFDKEVSIYKNNLPFIKFSEYKFKLILDGIELPFGYKTFTNTIIDNSSSIFRRMNGSLTKTHAYKYLAGSYYRVLFSDNTPKICFSDSKISTLKSSERSFLNDNNFEAIIFFNVRKIAFVITKVILKKSNFHKKLSINSIQLFKLIERKLSSDILDVKGKYLPDLNIPLDYGKTTQPKVSRLYKESVLAYKLSYYPSISRTEILESDIKKDKEVRYIYGDISDLKSLKKLKEDLELNTFDWVFFYCSKKYFSRLSLHENCFFIKDIIGNPTSGFYKVKYISDQMSLITENSLLEMLSNELTDKCPMVELIDSYSLTKLIEKVKDEKLTCEKHLQDFYDCISKINKVKITYKKQHAKEFILSFLFGDKYVEKIYNSFKIKNKKYFEMFEIFNNFIEYFKLELVLLNEVSHYYNDKYNSVQLISDNIKNYKLQQLNTFKNKI